MRFYSKVKYFRYFFSKFILIVKIFKKVVTKAKIAIGEISRWKKN